MYDAMVYSDLDIMHGSFTNEYLKISKQNLVIQMVISKLQLWKYSDFNLIFSFYRNINTVYILYNYRFSFNFYWVN